MELSKEQQHKREELRKKMQSLRDEAYKIQNHIKEIDCNANEKKLKSFVGKCFELNGTYARVDRRSEYDRFIGIKAEVVENSDLSIIYLNADDIYLDWLEEASQISEFDFCQVVKKIIDKLNVE